MTVYGPLGSDQGNVEFHEHDASEISGSGVFINLNVANLLAGTIDSKEIIISGAAGVIRSENFSAGSAGWQIEGDGDAEFNDVTVRGDIESANWDGGSNLASFDTGATAGFFLDSSVGSAQFMGDVFVGGNLELTDGSGYVKINPASFTSSRPQIELHDGGTGIAWQITANGLQLTLLEDDPSNPGFVSANKFETGRGTAGAPSFRFSSTDGMWSSGAGSLNFATAGVDRVSVAAARTSVHNLFNLVPGSSALTIAAGVVTATNSFHSLLPQSGTADDLDTVNGGSDGDILILRSSASANTITVKDGTGNLRLEGDFVMNNATDTITLLHTGSVWLETARSNNA